MKIKGSLLSSIPIVKRFSAENFPSPLKWGPKIAIFGGKEGLNVKFLLSNPQKARPCAEPRRLTYFAWKSVWGAWLWRISRTQKSSRGRINKATSRIWRQDPWRECHAILHRGDLCDVITCAKFDIDRLRGLRVAGGRISGFPIDLLVDYYNTLTLLCECVMQNEQLWHIVSAKLYHVRWSQLFATRATHLYTARYMWSCTVCLSIRRRYCVEKAEAKRRAYIRRGTPFTNPTNRSLVIKFS